MTRWTQCIPFTALIAVLAGCAENPSPRALPPQTMAPAPPETAEPITNAAESLPEDELTEMPAPADPPFKVVEEPAATAGSGSTVEATDDLTLVLDSPGSEEGERPRSLFEASQAEKERREQVGESTIVLTNKNLEEYSKGQLTFVEDQEGSADAAPESTPSEEPPEGPDEEYWRNRVLDIRIEWRESLDRIEELESEIARLRQQFYAEDDPFYRDAQIKPAWDQALVELEETRRSAEASQEELETAVDEGRREGALPGWLREGIELEPTEEELEERLPSDNDRIHRSTEPVVVDEPGDDG